MSSDKPLVTLIIIAFNQQDYVRDAVIFALAQSYSPLEIIISDDCSNDETWNQILRATNGYSGDHAVVLNRNKKNMGIAKHVDYLCRRAKGEFIVLAPGDDMSIVDRVEKLVAAWISLPARPSVVCSNAITIDQYGNEGDYLIDINKAAELTKFSNPYSRNFRFLGCTSGFDRKIYNSFPIISENIICEDAISFHRAHLMGGVQYIPDVLVKYRQHSGGSSQLLRGTIRQYVTTMRKWRYERLARISQYRKDIDYINNFSNKCEMIIALDQSELLENNLLLILEGNIMSSTGKLLGLLFFGQYTKKELLKMFLYRWTLSFSEKIWTRK